MVNWPYMSNKSKKMAVFATLQQQGSEISLSEILQLLGAGYSERSVRRWLAEMVSMGLVIAKGKKRSTCYQAITAISEKQISFNDKKALNYINQPLFERSPVTYNAKWLDTYLPNKTAYLTKELKLQLHHAGDQNKNRLPAGTYARQIYNRLLIDLSYNSSRLEGNTYSLLDTERLILEGAEVPGKLDEEKIMILNHKEAIAYLVNNAQKIQSNFNTICTLHYLLADGLVPTQYAGKVRDYGMRISGSTYIPWENPEKLNKQLEKISQKAALIKDPFEQSFFLLVHISYLQAFSDVNKRTSRLSANIPLIKNNMVPLSFNDISKSDYQSAMIAIYELNDVHMLVELYAHSYQRTCQLYAVTLEVINYDEVRVRYRQIRRKIISYIITHELFHEKLEQYIHNQVKKFIDPEDQPAFVQDVKEDLHEINPERIAGLGITVSQLKEWLNKYKK
ncbi:hypothetical protein AYO45_05445 [Gammaproteobacteria bacterium SCGC AG-212-F23]|nr:hypothetical protein AYO45_05445 [Gammaproteobacteria bacterium SCGC AG-212-F23]